MSSNAWIDCWLSWFFFKAFNRISICNLSFVPINSSHTSLSFLLLFIFIKFSFSLFNLIVLEILIKIFQHWLNFFLFSHLDIFLYLTFIFKLIWDLSFFVIIMFSFKIFLNSESHIHLIAPFVFLIFGKYWIFIGSFNYNTLLRKLMFQRLISTFGLIKRHICSLIQRVHELIVL
jgi:hypothetical protein